MLDNNNTTNKPTDSIDNLFLNLRQLQINLIKQTSKQSINEYTTQLRNLVEDETKIKTNQESQNLIHFLIYPILVVLKKEQSLQSDLCESLIESINLILNKIDLEETQLFYEILTTLSIVLSRKTEYSDEFYLSCFQLFNLIFQIQSIFESFFQFKNLTQIGLLVSLCLDILLVSSSIEVKLGALKSIQLLSGYNQSNSQIGHIYASFLPGISIKLIQRFLLSQNLKLINHKLICNCLNLLAHVITHVLNDKTKSLNETLDELNDNIKSLMVNRTNEWLKDTSDKLFTLIRPLLDELIQLDNLKIQKSLTNFCSQISLKCYFNLNQHLSHLLRVLVLYANSHNDQIAIKCLQELDLKETKHNGEYIMLNKFTILQNSIEDLVLKFPRLINEETTTTKNINESTKLSHLKTLHGYLKLVATNTYSQMDSIQLNDFFCLNLENLNKLLTSLITCVQFDYKNLDNFYQIETQIHQKDTSIIMSSYTGLKTYLNDTDLFDQLSQICSYLGRSDAARLVIDQLLTNNLIIQQQKETKCEIMYLINLILKGLNQSQYTDKKVIIINQVLANFINDFKRDTSFKSDLKSANRKILETCLVCESVGSASQCLKSQFDKYLIETLYFCLENYLNSNLLIKCVATKCLEELAHNLNHSTIQDLLSVNYDYIMNDLILNSYKQVKQNEQNVNVLCALLDISNSDLVHYLQRLVDDYFILIELNNHDVNILNGICSIMLHISRSMRKWYPIRINFVNQTSDQQTDRFLANLDLKSLVKAKQNLKTFSQTLNEIETSRIDFKLKQDVKIDNLYDLKQDLNEDDLIGDDDEKEKAEKKETPVHVKLQVKCLELCTHLISNAFKQIRLSIIDLISELSLNLAEHTNDFLPLAHKLWQPIMQRFSLDDLLIKSKIVYLLFDLSVYSSDFLASRFSREFMPRLNKFMQEQAKLSLKHDSTYIYSHAFKLQVALLTNLSKLCVLFDIKELEMENLLTFGIMVYLDKRQPKRLQLLAVEAIENCALIDPDCVWLCLHYVLPFNDHECQEMIYFSNKIKLKYEYQLNSDCLERLITLFNKI